MSNTEKPSSDDQSRFVVIPQGLWDRETEPYDWSDLYGNTDTESLRRIRGSLLQSISDKQVREDEVAFMSDLRSDEGLATDDVSVVQALMELKASHAKWIEGELKRRAKPPKYRPGGIDVVRLGNIVKPGTLLTVEVYPQKSDTAPFTAEISLTRNGRICAKPTDQSVNSRLRAHPYGNEYGGNTTLHMSGVVDRKLQETPNHVHGYQVVGMKDMVLSPHTAVRPVKLKS
jgi:hypothetical protein